MIRRCDDISSFQDIVILVIIVIIVAFKLFFLDLETLATRLASSRCREALGTSILKESVIRVSVLSNEWTMPDSELGRQNGEARRFRRPSLSGKIEYRLPITFRTPNQLSTSALYRPPLTSSARMAQRS
jgi:hypothetical protein